MNSIRIISTGLSEKDKGKAMKYFERNIKRFTTKSGFNFTPDVLIIQKNMNYKKFSPMSYFKGKNPKFLFYFANSEKLKIKPNFLPSNI